LLLLSKFNLARYSLDTSEASLGGDHGAAAADPAQRKFWSELGQLCKPWGGVALAHSPVGAPVHVDSP
jgi:hypothetical protein